MRHFIEIPEERKPAYYICFFHRYHFVHYDFTQKVHNKHNLSLLIKRINNVQI